MAGSPTPKTGGAEPGLCKGPSRALLAESEERVGGWPRPLERAGLPTTEDRAAARQSQPWKAPAPCARTGQLHSVSICPMTCDVTDGEGTRAKVPDGEGAATEQHGQGESGPAEGSGRSLRRAPPCSSREQSAETEWRKAPLWEGKGETGEVEGTSK